MDMRSDPVADFALITLPVLMELARKGCRYSDESIAPLRPSFRVIGV